ncbi:MAG: hypothetical protein FIB02_10200 [Desulfuromonas sp.]|nr:hypothetical protein [Desulfuromonas sp.]
MKACSIGGVFLAFSILGVMAQSSLAIDDIPDRKMVSKGGVLYPYTGDSTQGRFQTPKNARELFPSGTLVGVLPEDCVSTSNETAGDFYRCDNDFALKAVDRDGRTVYQVIDNP